MDAVTIPHLIWADALVTHLADENNEYGATPTYVEWGGVDAATSYKNRTLCNTFVSSMFKQGYGLTASALKAWLGSSSPKSAVWHDAIVAQNGFLLVERIGIILTGDIIAIKYPGDLSVSGHMAIVKSPPVLRTASAPVIADTLQYEVLVIDSANSGHGSKDTRKRPDGSSGSGAGAGTMRFYADASGTIAGHTWSTYSNSVFYAQSDRHLAVGRYRRP
jgi:hypothetical protein